MTDHFIRGAADLLPMLDELLSGQDQQRWDRFFADRARPIPFFVDAPDENLVEWFDTGRLTPGRVRDALRPGGYLGLVCFLPEGGSGFTDLQVYERGNLGGGLGYTPEQLRALFEADFEVETLRPMRASDGDHFGLDFLQVMLARRR